MSEYIHKILVVIDMQNDFVYGNLGTKEAQDTIPKIQTKIEEYNSKIQMVWFTQDSHQKNYLETQEGKHLPVEHCIEDTEGWRIIDEFSNSGDALFFKNSFGSIELINALKIEECDEVELVGVCTDICVISNALLIKTYFPEMKITVDSSCCAGVTPESHEAALQVMKMCHIDII